MFIENPSENKSKNLKAAREAKGLSLADVHQRTRINMAYLQAIENNDFSRLPIPVYARNFIRTYARTIGIDADAILSGYEDYLNGLNKVSPARNKPGGNLSFSKIPIPKSYLWVAAVVVVIILVSVLISKQYQSSSDTIGSAENATVPVLANAQQAVNSPVSALPVDQRMKTDSDTAQADISGKKTSLPVADAQLAPGSREAGLLVITATEDTWVRIKGDKSPSFYAVLRAGEKISRKATQFDIDIGNAGVVKVQFKGKNIENVGQPGHAAHLRLP
jgi:cytoskeleton protein RodZ